MGMEGRAQRVGGSSNLSGVLWGLCRSGSGARGPDMLLVSHNVQQRGHEHVGCYVS